LLSQWQQRYSHDAIRSEAIRRLVEIVLKEKE
jgi:hypothetical protein